MSSPAMRFDHVFRALGCPQRRALLERLVTRPHRLCELLEGSGTAKNTVRSHLSDLMDAGLIERAELKYRIVTLALPQLRMYFDRLWLEASLGDTWLQERRASMSDFGY